MKTSIALGTYNGGRYLAQQLDSFLSQARQPDELVVADDCSTDGTLGIVDSFARSAPFPVRVLRSPSNAGVVRNFARAIEACSGDLIALADQDDVWLPDKLLLSEAAFAGDDNVGLVFSDATLVDEALTPLGYSAFSAFGVSRPDRHRINMGDALRVLIRGGVVTGCTMAFRARYRRFFQPIPRTGHWIHDGWIALMISAIADVVVLEEELILYRQHLGQQIGAPMARGFVGLRRALRRVDRQELCDAAAALTEARERITRQLEPEVALPLIATIDARLRYLSVRSSMPRRRPRRIPAAVSKLIAGEYHGNPHWLGDLARDVIS